MNCASKMHLPIIEYPSHSRLLNSALLLACGYPSSATPPFIPTALSVASPCFLPFFSSLLFSPLDSNQLVYTVGVHYGD